MRSRQLQHGQGQCTRLRRNVHRERYQTNPPGRSGCGGHSATVKRLSLVARPTVRVQTSSSGSSPQCSPTGWFHSCLYATGVPTCKVYGTDQYSPPCCKLVNNLH